MRPSLSINEHRYGAHRDIVSPAKHRHWSSEICPLISNCSNIILGKNRLRKHTALGRSGWPPSLAIRILNCFAYRPSAHDSISQNVVTDTMAFGHIHHAERFSLVGKLMIASAIVRLLIRGGPSAIFRIIISIVVDAVKGVTSSWLVPHVLHKALKSGHSILSRYPSAANGYSPSSIISKLRNVFIATSGKHRGPLPVCGMPACGWLVIGRNRENVFAGLAHVYDGLSSSAGQSVCAAGLCVFLHHSPELAIT